MAAFLRVRELLAPAGVFHVLVPDIGDRRRTPIARWHPAHVHGFTRATLTMMALKAGFVLDEYDDGTPQLLLRNAPVPTPWFVYPDHARTMRAFFDTHTWWRHLASATPYRKFVRRMMRFARERSARATE
jgi:hypothetical protein